MLGVAGGGGMRALVTAGRGGRQRCGRGVGGLEGCRKVAGGLQAGAVRRAAEAPSAGPSGVAPQLDPLGGARPPEQARLERRELNDVLRTLNSYFRIEGF